MNISIRLFSNINIDPLKSLLQKAGIEQVETTGYNQFMQELLGQRHNENLPAGKSSVVYFHINAAEFWSDEVASFASYAHFYAKLENLLVLVEKYCASNTSTIVLMSNFSFSSQAITTFIDQDDFPSLSVTEAELNLALFKFSRRITNLFIDNFVSIVTTVGLDYFIDSKLWYLGRIKYSMVAFKAISNNIMLLLNAIFNPPKKVLVLDLDNTLWGGVLGETGPLHVQLSEDGVGKIYRDFQKNIKSLKSLGVLLAVCSKNNLGDVKELFDTNKMLVLSEKDFISRKINWINKADNIRSIAEELNLGLDAFVFIDDNPVERKMVKEMLPQVIVPEFPAVTEKLNYWFLTEVVYPYFARTRITKEDIHKADQYIRNQKRSEAQSALNLESFIESLGIVLDICENDRSHIPRVAQLTQKTNQFNLTTRRYQENDISRFIEGGTHLVFSLDYTDNFGKEGIIGVAIVEVTGNAARMDTFLMSCRVIGRTVEFKFLLEIMQTLKMRKVKKVVAEYLATKKNGLCAGFYHESGFKQNSANEFEQDIDVLIEKLKQK